MSSQANGNAANRSRARRRPLGSSSARGSILSHVQVRRHSVSQQSQPLHSPPTPLPSRCFITSTPPVAHAVIHRRTEVRSVVTETYFLTATPGAPFLPLPPPPTTGPSNPTPPEGSQIEHLPVVVYGHHGQLADGPPEDFYGHDDDNDPQTVAQKTAQNARIVHEIELLFLRMVQQLAAGEPATIEYDQLGDSWADFELLEDGRLQLKPHGLQRKSISMARMESVARFVSIVKLLGRIKTLLIAETYVTKRELFYEHVNLYGTQDVVDSAINTITLLLKAPRRCLNITATNKGLVAGHLIFLNEAGAEFNCMQTVSGVPVPTLVRDTEIVQSTAKFILVVEKDASFQQLLEEEICHIPNYPCIMVTARGYPDEATRYFLMKLVKKLNIPIFAITDADPHGVDIMCMYRYGTKAPHFGNIALAIPEMLWMGVFPSDLGELEEFNANELVELTERERDLANDILDRPYCGPALRHEVELMLHLDRKFEIQNVNALGERFFVDVYLREKLLRQEWI